MRDSPEGSRRSNGRSNRPARSNAPKQRIWRESRSLERVTSPYAEKLLPQPHVPFTLGLLNLNPEPCIPST